MQTLTTTFLIPDHISQGLASGIYERVGGVIREVGSKQVVAWLREGLNIHNLQGLLQITSAASMLNLGVSVIGFAVIIHRLDELEKRLQSAGELLTKINRKIDLSFYAKFRAALNLATNAFTMNKPENRRSSALAAINLFLEAEHFYTAIVDQELQERSQVVDEYLLTLALAYIAEARCYLELEEWDTALRRFQEGAEKLRTRVAKYIEILLTSNPAAYLDPQFKGQIDLHRLTRVYQWIDPSLDESAVFELLRDPLFNWKKDQGIESGYKWIQGLPPAIVASSEVQGSIFGNREEMKVEAMNRLPQVLEVMESMIETSNRFEAYQAEIKAISQIGIPFHDWMKLAPAEAVEPKGANLMYIVPPAPMAV